MIVLPGETVCRKCGAYIDIPEEIKAKMKRKVEYSVCSECGAEVPMDARRCPKCGANFDEETEEVVIEASEEEIAERIEKQESSDDSFECSECGAKVPADADVCPQCGARFDEDEE
jgi:ribosomal protein L40E